jgi:beta-N-acetylhexosaminidase
MRFPETVEFPLEYGDRRDGKPDYARRWARLSARESKAMGVQQVFAPVVDVNNNADNPVINVRSYGEDPEDVARFAARSPKACKSKRAGDGEAFSRSRRHGGRFASRFAVINFRASARKDRVAPFRALINAGIGSVMISHIDAAARRDESRAAQTIRSKQVTPNRKSSPKARRCPRRFRRHRDGHFEEGYEFRRA